MYRVVRDTIDPRVLERAAGAEDGDRGGIVTFLGIVRNRADDERPVKGLWYEAFEPMAAAEFERIAGEARVRFGDVRIAIVHRIGALAAGEIAVAVVAAAAHRKSAFDACEYTIDELKRRAPIWKKERYADGSETWKSNAADE